MRNEVKRYYLIRELMRLIEEINKENLIVIVEGKKDKIVVRELGFKGEVIYPSMEIVKGKSYVILTDFDKEGKRIASLLSKKIGEKNVMKVYRERFYSIIKEIGIKEIQDIGKMVRSIKSILS